jgi:hypothetical protein
MISRHQTDMAHLDADMKMQAVISARLFRPDDRHKKCRSHVSANGWASSTKLIGPSSGISGVQRKRASSFANIVAGACT